MSTPKNIKQSIVLAVTKLYIEVAKTKNNAYDTFIFDHDASEVQDILNTVIETFDAAHVSDEGWQLSCPYSEGNKYYLQVTKGD